MRADRLHSDQRYIPFTVLTKRSKQLGEKAKRSWVHLADERDRQRMSVRCRRTAELVYRKQRNNSSKTKTWHKRKKKKVTGITTGIEWKEENLVKARGNSCD